LRTITYRKEFLISLSLKRDDQETLCGEVGEQENPRPALPKKKKGMAVIAIPFPHVSL
jgi:hypothetical protein